MGRQEPSQVSPARVLVVSCKRVWCAQDRHPLLIFQKRPRQAAGLVPLGITSFGSEISRVQIRSTSLASNTAVATGASRLIPGTAFFLSPISRHASRARCRRMNTKKNRAAFAAHCFDTKLQVSHAQPVADCPPRTLQTLHSRAYRQSSYPFGYRLRPAA
jgi:hypothetical protein